MYGRISYLNTDLDLTSDDDLTILANALAARGVLPIHLAQEPDGSWLAIFETEDQHGQPEANIAVMLDAIETLPEPLRPVWFGCTRRELNIGYECGEDPWDFSHALSASLLERISAIDAALRITLYPHKQDEPEE